MSVLSSSMNSQTLLSSSTSPIPSPTSSKPQFIPKHLPLPASTAAVRLHRHFPDRAAFPESLPLHSKNPRSIYHDIQRLARLGNLREALAILDYLDHRGIPVNTTTFLSLLSAASTLNSLSSARRIHVHLRINGLHRNELLLAKLVETYARCGSVKHAQLIFSELSPATVYPWNALLRGNLSGGSRWDFGPLSVFSAMRAAGVEANEYTFSSLLKSFAGSPALGEGMKAHALLVKNGFAGSPLLIRTGLVDMYFKCRRIHMAVKVFDEIPQKDIVSWGAVIAGFAHNQLRWEALECLRWMCGEGIEPNSVVLTSVLPIVGELSEQNLGKEIHCFVIKRFRNYTKMVSIQSSLIDMYSKCGNMASARRVFYGSSERNEVSWTALISGYASNNRLEQALRSIVWMQKEGIKPDIVTIATVLPICSRLKAWRQGQEIHGYSLKHCFLPNVSIETSLMTTYSECGKLDSCRRVFDGIRWKNIIAWTALMESYFRNGSPGFSLAVFRSMVRTNRRPDSVVVCRILKFVGELGALKLGKEIHAQVYKLKFETTALVVAEAVIFYGKCGELKNSQRLFDGIQVKGSLTCTAIIEAYMHNKLYREALDMFHVMLTEGFCPNHYTFDAVFSVCDKAGLAQEALWAFEAMIRKYKLNATVEQLDCLIGILTRAGRVDEAQSFAQLRSRLV